MDWVNQNKLKTALIVVLLALNILTLGTIWMQMAGSSSRPAAEPDVRPAEPAPLMKEALNFSDAQLGQYEKLRTQLRDQSKQDNERLTELKTQLGADVFADKNDTVAAAAKSTEIGRLEAKVEFARYTHFRSLAAICTPEQKEKLKPILAQLFGRKPPREESVVGSKPDNTAGRTQRGAQGDQRKNENDDQQRSPQTDHQQGPPSIGEKLAKYTERLKLTAQQSVQVQAVLSTSYQRAEQLRSEPHPERGAVEAEKERIRKDEDSGIMKILTSDQKSEFEKMIEHRRR
jgi:Spy/CpxP family protein refolding chaperone